jgi:PAT family beta-lactamase induction signal transducer AmpG
VGLIYRHFGINCATIGGILGGIAISKKRLNYCILPMILIMHLPIIGFILLAHYQPTTLFNLYLDLNLLLSIGPLIHISTAVVIEQLGYGMGLAFMMYLIYVAE